MSNYICRVLDPNEYDEWDKFVDLSPQGTLFHRSYWLGASGMDFGIYGCFKDDQLTAGLPLTYRSRFGIMQATHPPLTPYLGILFRDRNAKYVNRISDEKKIAGLIARRIKDDFKVIRFKLTPAVIDLQPFIWEGFSSSVRYTYLLDLRDLDAVWNGMAESRRRNIKRAEKDGVYVEADCAFEVTLNLVKKTFQRQNQETGFIENAIKFHQVLDQRKQCHSFISHDASGEPIAAVYIVWDNKRSYYLLGGYAPEKGHHGGSALAMWEAIKFTKAKLGLDEFDFEGSMVQPVEQFFRKFGGTLTPYYSVRWSTQLLQYMR